MFRVPCRAKLPTLRLGVVQGIFQSILEKLVSSKLTNDEALEGQIHGLELTNCG